QAFVAAVAHLDLGRRSDVSWAGRATLVTRGTDLPGYDRVFSAWFEGSQVPTAEAHPERSGHQAAVRPGDSGDDAASAVSTLASAAAQLRHLAVAQLVPAARAWRNCAIRALPAPRPTRRTYRTGAYHHGRVGRVRTLRAELRR